MKEHKYNFVYKTTNNINGDYYIGVHSTDNLNDGYIGSGLRLGHSIKKYGKENFTREYVKFFNCRKDAYSLEAEIVTPELLQDPHCMNIAVGGHGGNTLSGFNEQELEQFKQQCKESHNKPEYTKKIANIVSDCWTREDYRNKQIERIKSTSSSSRPEVRKKISENKKQFYAEHPEAREELSKNNPSKREDVKQKMRHKHNMSEEGLRRIREGAKKRTGDNNGMRKKKCSQVKIS